MPRKTELRLGIPDKHIPHHEEALLDLVLRFAKKLQPQTIINLGDDLDCYPYSRFPKDPLLCLSFQEHLDRLERWYRDLRGACPNSDIYYLAGNHERWYTLYRWGPAQMMSGLRGLDIPSLLHLKDYGVQYCDNRMVQIAGCLYKHGTHVFQASGASGLKELNTSWQTGMSGHTHRLGTVYRSTDRTYSWTECGCLCKKEMDYTLGTTVDWQHGLGLHEVCGDRIQPHTISLEGGHLMWQGITMEAKHVDPRPRVHPVLTEQER